MKVYERINELRETCNTLNAEIDFDVIYTDIDAQNAQVLNMSKTLMTLITIKEELVWLVRVIPHDMTIRANLQDKCIVINVYKHNVIEVALSAKLIQFIAVKIMARDINKTSITDASIEEVLEYTITYIRKQLYINEDRYKLLNSLICTAPKLDDIT